MMKSLPLLTCVAVALFMATPVYGMDRSNDDPGQNPSTHKAHPAQTSEVSVLSHLNKYLPGSLYMQVVTLCKSTPENLPRVADAALRVMADIPRVSATPFAKNLYILFTQSERCITGFCRLAKLSYSERCIIVQSAASFLTPGMLELGDDIPYQVFNIFFLLPPEDHQKILHECNFTASNEQEKLTHLRKKIMPRYNIFTPTPMRKKS